MNILLSAFSCRPNWGSEPGVGWKFATTLAKNHKVIVLTGYRNKADIEKDIANQKHGDNLTFIYYDLPLPKWLQIRNYESGMVHIYYFFWQIYIFFKAKAILKQFDIDIIHHITTGVFRTPSFLALLKKPFIFGPVGGGESYPFQLKRSLPFKYLIIELARDFINRISVMNPLLHLTFKNSTLIGCRTNETLKSIPKKYHSKCTVAVEIGLKDVETEYHSHGIAADNHNGLKLLFAGRLLYWKGIHLAIAAYAKILKKFPETKFTIIGSGSDEEWIKETARSHQVYDKIEWIDRVSQATLFDMYQRYDLLVFPSLRDSGGTVVLEAIAHHLPVLCLDVGGPCQIVDSHCGIIIDTHNQTQKSLTEEINSKLEYLHNNRDLLYKLKENTWKRAQDFTMDKVVNNIYNSYILAEKEFANSGLL